MASTSASTLVATPPAIPLLAMVSNLLAARLRIWPPEGRTRTALGAPR